MEQTKQEMNGEEYKKAKAKYEEMLAKCRTLTDKQLVEHTWKERPTLEALEELEALCL